MKRLAIVLLFIAPLSSFGKDDWQSDLQHWVASTQFDPNCKIRYTTGIYRPDMGAQAQWGLMTEKMFKWFSEKGGKLAPTVCPAGQSSIERANYRILISQSPMATASQTTHGYETHTATQPFSANVDSRTTYSDGSYANTTGTIYGQQSSTVVVPAETTISRSSVAVYMYAYRVSGDQMQLIGTDRVVFTRVAASGYGDNAAGAELGAGIGNLIRASGDRHRADKLYEEALNSIRADSQGGTVAPPAAPAQTEMLRDVSTAPQRSSVSVSDSARAVSYDEGCSKGDMQSCEGLGTMYRMGWGVERNPQKANALFKKACDGGGGFGCKFVALDITPSPSPSNNAETTSPTIGKADTASSSTSQATVSLNSTPSGADIEIDGAFVGNTPSTVTVPSGTHQIVVKKKGFSDWGKSLSVTSGTVQLNAELEQQ